METTKFISDSREALLVTDYNAYRAQLSHRILSLRRHLGLATHKREKYNKFETTAEHIAQNRDYGYLLLLTAERAWAHAMHIKESHTDDTSRAGVTGRARSHIVSRLAKGAKVAEKLVALLQTQGSTKQDSLGSLETLAYQSTLAGAAHFESAVSHGLDEDGRRIWQKCLEQYSTARIIYASLHNVQHLDVYRDVLMNTVDPSIRYAAYQARMSRTIPVPVIATRCFPVSDTALVRRLENIDPNALKEQTSPRSGDLQQAADLQDIPNSINWRERKANVVDAAIGQALAAVSLAHDRLQTTLSQTPSSHARENAAAYDDVLNAAQDAADAVKAATGEMEKENVDEGDSRMQDLRVTSLAIHYELVCWRVGRNRVLIGSNDGLTLKTVPTRNSLKRRGVMAVQQATRGRGGRQIAHLRERVVLYDAIIQSVQSVKDLRGALGDTSFMRELDDKTLYFRALKCLNIAYSYSLRGRQLQCLALLYRAEKFSGQITLDSLQRESDPVPKLNISHNNLEALKRQISKSISRSHALVELGKLYSNTSSGGNTARPTPISRNMQDFQVTEATPEGISFIPYPLDISPVPVKPLFLDIAWNYVEYPSQKLSQQSTNPAVKKIETGIPSIDTGKLPEKRKGWFGFGK